MFVMAKDRTAQLQEDEDSGSLDTGCASRLKRKSLQTQVRHFLTFLTLDHKFFSKNSKTRLHRLIEGE